MAKVSVLCYDSTIHAVKSDLSIELSRSKTDWARSGTVTIKPNLREGAWGRCT
jgi:hypothetical protein